MEEEILKLYYINKMKQKDIANILNIGAYVVTRAIQKDSRYIEEKNNRKRLNKIKHNKDIQRRVENKRRKQSANDLQILKTMHEQASRELSGGKKPMSNRAFRDWNTSIYKYNSKNQSYVLKKGINVGSDVPKRISWKSF